MAFQQIVETIRRWWCRHDYRQTDLSPWRLDPDVGHVRTCTVTCLDCGAVVQEWNELMGAPWS